MRAEEAVDEAGRGGEATARPLCAQRPAGGAQRTPWRGALGQPVPDNVSLLPKTVPSFRFPVASWTEGLLQVLRTVLLRVCNPQARL